MMGQMGLMGQMGQMPQMPQGFGAFQAWGAPQPFMGQQHSIEQDISKDINKIHMYDTILMGGKATPGANKQRMKSELRRKF